MQQNYKSQETWQPLEQTSLCPASRSSQSMGTVFVSGVPLPTFLLLVPVLLRAVNGACLPLVRTPGLGWPIFGFHCSLPKVGVYLCIIPFLFCLYPGTQVLMAFLPFLPDYVHIFLTALAVQESFCLYYIYSII